MPDAEDRRKAKDQALRLVRVDSTDCTMHIGAISYFRQDELEFHWRDRSRRSRRNWNPLMRIPEQSDHRIRSKVISHSGGK